MIVGIINPGSGLGDSLFSYFATRTTAERLGVPFGFVGKEFFKGASFMNPNFGEPVSLKYSIEYPSGKLMIYDEHKLFTINTPSFNPEFDFIEDGTVIDGYGAQDERYFRNSPETLLGWLNISPEKTAGFFDKVCVINFRGGEYKFVPDLYLPQEYWDTAIAEMKRIGLDDDHFLVVTDDPEEAKRFFPNFKITHSIDNDWTSILVAEYLIIPNSAFPIIPALLNRNARKIIAPRYWAGRNVKEWRRPGNYYPKFTYV